MDLKEILPTGTRVTLYALKTNDNWFLGKGQAQNAHLFFSDCWRNKPTKARFKRMKHSRIWKWEELTLVEIHFKLEKISYESCT